jgi:hypothetical protein
MKRKNGFNALNIIGHKYGMLAVVRRSDKKNSYGKREFFECICECGKETLVKRCNLVTGHTKSCGCYRRLIGKKRMADMKRTTTSIEERFWDKVVKSSGCWEWKGTKDNRGYPRIATRRGKSPIRASRLSYIIHYGSIPKGLCVCHKCDNPGCVNPEHLFVGTQKDNMMDASRKNRLNVKSLTNLRPGCKGFRGTGPISNNKRKEVNGNGKLRDK